jgi:5'-AMP-activated protein kinase regulatory beta subunit
MEKIKSKQKIKRRRATFSFESSDAKEVILMGDFNNWSKNKHPMKNNGNGMWNKSVMIPPGRYEYKFLVDRQWKEDPQNDQTCLNCFGTYNNVFNLTGA